MSDMQTQRPITGEGVREILGAKVVKEGVPPSRAACERLASALEALAETAGAETLRRFAVGADPGEGIQDALRTLAGSLTAARLIATASEQREIDRLANAVAEASFLPWAKPRAEAPTRAVWHRFAEPMVDAFRAAMQASNPGLPLPPSNHGPVARFLEAFIPIVTDEHPKGETAARYLQRLG